MTKRRGSALIIALLLISVIGGLAFGIGRLVFLETITATAYENGSVAYFAAESGIEEGFLRYRYDRNAEIPQTNWQLNGTTMVYRNNLTDFPNVFYTGTGYVGIDQSLNDNIVNAKQFYDLRMGFIGTNGKPWYGQSDIAHPENYSLTDSTTLITADNTKKIDLSLMTLSNPIYSLALLGRFNGSISDADNCRAFLEATLTIQYSGSTKADQYKDFYVNNTSSCGTYLKIDASKLSQFDSFDNTYHSFTINNIDRKILTKAGVPIPVAGDKISITIKPLYYNLTIGLATANCQNTTCASGIFTHSDAVPGPYTTITSTGYYGGISRKISANIDRESGTLYDLYDYVLFKGN